MQDNSVLQRFKKFKNMILSADIPGDLLLEMAESYITSDTDDTPAEENPVLDGQMSLYDYKICA